MRAPEPTPIHITRHAANRWRERGGPGDLTDGMVRRRLLGKLRSGARCLTGAVYVALGRGLVAVCKPERCGWSVVTILDVQRGENADAGS